MAAYYLSAMFNKRHRESAAGGRGDPVWIAASLTLLAMTTLFFCSPALARTLATPTVDITNTIYDDLDILTAVGLIKTRIVGQRPYTRNQIAHFLITASETLETNNQHLDFVAEILKRDCEEFSDDIATLSPPLSLREKASAGRVRGGFHPLRQFNLSTTVLHSSARPYFQMTSAQYNPLVQNQAGRHFANGLQTSLESQSDLQIGDAFSFALEPRLQIQARQDGENAVFLQQGYASVAFGNHQLDLGRKALVLGQSRHGGMVLSDNARPLDGVQLTNLQPWRLKVLGKLKYTFFFADLGPEQNFQNPFFSGIKLSILPHPLFEFGVTKALIFGGSGAPNASFSDMFLEYFGVRPGDINITNLSNSLIGFESRLRIPSLRNTEVYGEFYFDDFNSSYILRSFKQDTAILIGINVVRLDDKGSLGLCVEGRKMSPIIYKHGSWTSGWTENAFTLGDPLGGEAESISVRLRKNVNLQTTLATTLTTEKIASDVYSGTGARGRFVTTSGPAETRYRGVIEAEHHFSKYWTKRWSANANLGYERVQGFNFVTGDNRNNFVGSLELQYKP